MTRSNNDENAESLDHTQIGPVPSSPDDFELASVRQVLNHGRYRTERILGSGGFGTVYLAHDTQLKRLVAIKIPHRSIGSSAERRDAYLAEARIVAQLEHPGIVPVFDVGSDPAIPCFIVSRYVSGESLAAVIKRGRLPVRESVRITAAIAEALHFAHKRGVVHLDVKPGNILLGEGMTPFVVDFGLALRDEDPRENSALAGTAMYMSPEQARGEGHRIDGRTDVYSLGVVLYEMLAGRKPYRASTIREMLMEVVEREPRPLRQLDETLPRELDRICSKAMAKRASDRYSTAFDFADDLRTFLLSSQPGTEIRVLSAGTVPPLQESAARHSGIPDPAEQASDSNRSSAVVDSLTRSQSGRLTLVPKGLRSFDQDDADFFVDLLPGPKDRSGIPASLQFWKKQIETRDPDATFEVGLIYGPSGSGKSSFLKAGLLPLLSENVRTVYLDCAAGDIEKRLCRSLRQLLKKSSSTDDLFALMSALRRGQDGNETTTLIILDQFEQWLHRRSGRDGGELINALRQCDGLHLQCILTVRDDFWMGVTSVLAELEIPLVQGRNIAPMDLFPVRHAKKVLTAFGQAFGELPSGSDRLTDAHELFITKAVESLAVDGKVICVHLTMFAEMMKERPWNLSTLTQVGGPAGLGVTFLEDTFGSRFASPRSRMHAPAVRAVLSHLLPAAGDDIRGHIRSGEQLMQVSGYAETPRAFHDLIQLLDQDLRLISPTDNASLLSPSAVDEQKYYQITHDYLIRPIREWLQRKQRETRRGRTQLFLSERSALWSAHKKKILLPSILETLGVIGLTNRTQWTAPEKEMMTQAVRHHLTRATLGFAVVTASGLYAMSVYRGQERKNSAALVEGQIASFIDIETSRISERLPQITSQLDAIKDRLALKYEQSEEGSRERLHAAFGLLGTDPRYYEVVQTYLLSAGISEIDNLAPAIQAHISANSRSLHDIVNDSTKPAAVRVQSVCLLMFTNPDPATLADDVPKRVAEQLVSLPTTERQTLQKILVPIKDRIADDLNRIVLDEGHSDIARLNACSALTEYWNLFPDKLLSLLKVAPESQYQQLIEALRPSAALVTEQCRNLLGDLKGKAESEKEERLQASWKANYLLCMFNLNAEAEALQILRADADPQLHSYITQRMASRGCNLREVFRQLSSEQDPLLLSTLIKCLSFYPASQILLDQRQVNLLQDLLQHGDAEVHSSTSYLLRKWSSLDQRLADITAKSPAASTPAPGRCTWTIDEFAGEMAVMPIAEFDMGSPPSDIYRYSREFLHRRAVNRTIAVSLYETTWESYQKFLDATGRATEISKNQDLDRVKSYAESDKAPRGGFSWYHAAEYCNWLSDQAGLPCCYKPNSEGHYDEEMEFVDNHLQLTGYRLPTEAEWEFACRAGTTTSKFCGSDDSTLLDYAWFITNSDMEFINNPDGNGLHNVGMRLPNRFGLFDIMGNAGEWCEDLNQKYQDIVNGSVPDDPAGRIRSASVDDTRISRGGSFGNRPRYLRSAARSFGQPSDVDDASGMRIVRTLVVPALPTTTPPK